MVIMLSILVTVGFTALCSFRDSGISNYGLTLALFHAGRPLLKRFYTSKAIQSIVNV